MFLIEIRGKKYKCADWGTQKIDPEGGRRLKLTGVVGLEGHDKVVCDLKPDETFTVSNAR
jgi:hypothetical protein